MRLRIIAMLAVVATLFFLGGLIAQRNVSLLGAPAASPASVSPANLVITTWVADPSVTAGPYPGYRPRTTAITPDMVTSASAGPDPDGGTEWVVVFTFDARGIRIFGQVTTDAYNACGGGQVATCPGNYVTFWLDLTQEDMDRWNTRASNLYRPFGQGGKLLSNPYVQSPTTRGPGLIIRNRFARQEAVTLAARLNR